MPDLLLELFSEEIPARMQAQAAADLRKLVTDALVERGLTYEGADQLRDAAPPDSDIVGLPARQPDQREEKKGPRVGAPEAAVQGFLKSAGLASLDAGEDREGQEGRAILCRGDRAQGRGDARRSRGNPARYHSNFPWPKSMRWGAASADANCLRWVRPLHSILATFGPETEEPEIVPFEIDGIAAGNITYGHRFMAPRPIKVRRFDDYLPALEEAKVVLDPARRRDIILHDCKDLAFAQGLELVEDEGLLDEVAGLVEWPVALMGDFDASFLEIPAGGDPRHHPGEPEMFCACATPRPAALANKFHAGVQYCRQRRRQGHRRRQWPRGAGAAVGCALFLENRSSAAARLCRPGQAARPAPGEAAGAQYRVPSKSSARRASGSIASSRWRGNWRRKIGADPDQAARAAELSKADLVTEVVGEFPETQGLMGRRYAELQGEDPEVAAAIEDHYKPQGPSDRIPTAPVSHRCGARRQARYAGRLLGDRRKADRQQGPLCAAPRRLGRDPHHSGE